MKKLFPLTLGTMIALGVVAVPVATPAFAAKKKEEATSGPKAKVSDAFRKPIGAAQEAVKTKDFATAQAKLTEASAIATMPDEKYYVGIIELQIAQANGDKALQAKAIEDVLASGSELGNTDRPKFLFYSGQNAYTNKDYPTAVTRLTDAQKAGYNTTDADLLLAESNFKLNQVPTGLGYVEKAIATEKAAGRVPPEDWYKRAASMAYQAKLMPEVAKWTRLQVAAYPSDENWRSTLIIYRDGANLDSQMTLDLYRLMRASKAITSERDYGEYAQLAADRGLPGEAKAVIDEGAAAGKLNKTTPGVSDVYKASSAKVAADRASLPASEKAAATAKDGKVALSTADGYLGYGDYAKAAELYKVAIGKGGIDANIANTRLGIALGLGGQKDAAKAAFAAVTGPRADLAQFWVQWLDQRTA